LIQPNPDFGAECGRSAEEGESMSKATYPLKLPTSIKKAAQRLAKEDGVSLNQWIAVAVAEKWAWLRRRPISSSDEQERQLVKAL
jgi:predicted HicB family RNase H-like nuclease